MARAGIRFVRTTAPQVASRRPPYELRKMILTGLGLWVAWCLVRVSTDLRRLQEALT
jgi:hypothetical protein